VDLRLEQCARCGKLFSRIRLSVCAACEADEEADFQRVRDALARQPGLSVDQVAQEAEVERDCVLRMLEEGRIENGHVAEEATCGQCGAPAISARKRLCQACLMKMDRECAEAMREMKEKMDADAKGAVHEVRKAVAEKRGLTEPVAGPAGSKGRMAIQERLKKRRESKSP